jgi:Rieske Fe-S protein
MSINRRQFVIASAALAAGCSINKQPEFNAATIDAGPASNFDKDGVYSDLRDQGIMIVRAGPNLVALSSVCTHMGCKVMAVDDSGFKCPCHGSQYDLTGKVIHGPAKYDLPQLPSSVNSSGRLIITATATA